MKPNDDPFAPLPEKLGIYNPLKDDFTAVYDSLGEEPQTFTVRAGEIEHFLYWIGLHVRKHLMDAVINARGLDPRLPEVVQQVLDEITV